MHINIGELSSAESFGYLYNRIMLGTSDKRNIAASLVSTANQ